MRALFDTNVILDVLLKREPFVTASAAALSRVEIGEISGWLGATTVTTLYYLIRKAVGPEKASGEIRKLLSIFEIAPVTRSVLEGASAIGFDDFEDAVLHEAAQQIEAKAIVTRNPRHFAHSELPVYTPDEFLEILDLQVDQD